MENTENWEYDNYVYMDIDYFRNYIQKYANTLKAEDRKKALTAIKTYERIKITVDNIKNVTMVQDKIKELGYQPQVSNVP